MSSVVYPTLSGKAYHNSRCLWIMAALIISIKHKHALFKKYKKGKTSSEEYKT